MTNKIEFSDDPNYKNNDKIKDWHGEYPKIFEKHNNFRSMLSTHDRSCVFYYNGQAFQTVQHALQYMKFSLQNNPAAKSFSLSSKATLSRRSAKRANRIGSRLHMTSEEKKKWDMLHDILIAEITEEKYAQNAHTLFAAVLCATKDAELWFVDESSNSQTKKVRVYYLEQIRERLQLVLNVVESCFDAYPALRTLRVGSPAAEQGTTSP